jgi:Ion channel
LPVAARDVAGLAAVVQSVRVLRLLRPLRSLRLAPHHPTPFTPEGLRHAALLTVLTALAGSAAFAAAENYSLGNGIYWATSTMTTVGGNTTPKSPEGKIISIAVQIVGIGFASLIIGAVAQQFIPPTVNEVEISDDELVEEVRHLRPVATPRPSARAAPVCWLAAATSTSSGLRLRLGSGGPRTDYKRVVNKLCPNARVGSKTGVHEILIVVIRGLPAAVGSHVQRPT